MDNPEQVAAHLSRNLSSLRHVRGLTQEALAKSAEVPRSTIANLESGTGNPSLTVLLKVAGALGVPIEELLASPRAKVRKWDAAAIETQDRGQGVTLRQLIPESVPDEILTLMDFAPGGIMRGTPHLPGTREYFSCLLGQVTIFVAGDRYDLGTGDVVAFPGNLPHSYQNPDERRAARGVSAVVLARVGV
jgi:transcriptional regulator with XRE-family HTH domain